MDNTQKLEELNKLQELYQEYLKQEDLVYNVFPCFTESPLVDSMDKLLNYLVGNTARLLEIEKEALYWHMWDNNWGENKLLTVLEDGTHINVTSNEDFLKTV